MDSSELTKFNEAVKNYYKLKQKYDSTIEREVVKIRKNIGLTNFEKRNKFKQINRKCINCGRAGGTIFKQENSVLSATCGHIEKPCKLDIQLQRAKHYNINQEIDKLNEKININRTNTINSKLDFLFGYSKQDLTINKFNNYKAELIEEVKKYQILNELHLNIVNNSMQKTQLLENTNNLSTLINKFKELIKNYEETGNIQFLKEAIELYKESIIETAKTIQNLKYSYNAVEYNEKDNTNHLIQELYSLEQLQVTINNTANKIIAFKK